MHASAVVSFSSEEEIERLLARLGQIHPSLVRDFEPELVVLYPSVRRRLRKAGITPEIALIPDGRLVRGKI